MLFIKVIWLRTFVLYTQSGRSASHKERNLGITKKHISAITFLVSDYDEAIEFFVSKLEFDLLEDAELEDGKRWVRVAPKHGETSLLLAKAVDDRQITSVGKQSGGRVWLFLTTDDFDRDYARMIKHRIKFLEEPRSEPYGKVAVFEDLYGNQWDLIQPAKTE